MNLLFEEGECVKHVIAYAKIAADGYSPGELIWEPAVVIRAIDFGYEILCKGVLKEVHAMDLERIDESR